MAWKDEKHFRTCFVFCFKETRRQRNSGENRSVWTNTLEKVLESIFVALTSERFGWSSQPYPGYRLKCCFALGLRMLFWIKANFKHAGSVNNCRDVAAEQLCVDDIVTDSRNQTVCQANASVLFMSSRAAAVDRKTLRSRTHTGEGDTVTLSLSKYIFIHVYN